ncbi:MAG: hypothetical protein IJK17_00160 [Lachnospiraceae bacterium]|nr:hypothetical protein [Lachnospiraceae bacterium]
MAKAKGVSSKTHSQKQLDDYANQHNPNNKAYKARVANDQSTKKKSKKASANQAKKKAKRQAEFDERYGLAYSLDWMCYSNPFGFD